MTTPNEIHAFNCDVCGRRYSFAFPFLPVARCPHEGCSGTLRPTPTGEPLGVDPGTIEQRARAALKKYGTDASALHWGDLVEIAKAVREAIDGEPRPSCAIVACPCPCHTASKS